MVTNGGGGAGNTVGAGLRGNDGGNGWKFPGNGVKTGLRFDGNGLMLGVRFPGANVGPGFGLEFGRGIVVHVVRVV